MQQLAHCITGAQAVFIVLIVVIVSVGLHSIVDLLIGALIGTYGSEICYAPWPIRAAALQRAA